MEQKYCQSCGMPMSAKEDFGTEKSGNASHDYCTYCYKDGKFTSDCTMDEMIGHCARFVDQRRGHFGNEPLFPSVETLEKRLNTHV